MRLTLLLASLFAVLAAIPAAASAAPVADEAALRAAVDATNVSDDPADEIELAGGATYTFEGAQCSAANPDEDLNASGDLDIDRSQDLLVFTDIDDPPASIEMACARERVLEVVSASELTLRNVRITGGAATGVGGGGVLTQGDLVLDRSRFADNLARDGANAGDLLPEAGDGGGGGAVYAQGNVTALESEFARNLAGSGGNGLDQVPCGTPAMTGGAGGDGGSGGAIVSHGGLELIRSSFAANRSGSGGAGGDGQCGTTAIGDDGGNGGAGGTAGAAAAVVCFCSGETTVARSTFSGNIGGDGGAGGAGGIARPASDTGIGGAGGEGGGTASVNDSPLAALAVSAAGTASLEVTNSTFDGNVAGSGGPGGPGGDGPQNGLGGVGGVGGDGAFGADVSTQDGSGAFDVEASLVHVTAASSTGGEGGGGGANGAPSPGAAVADGQSAGGSLFLQGSWEANGIVLGGAETGPDCWTAAGTSFYSVDTDTSCVFDGPTDLGTAPFADFDLAPLAENGGPTRTRLPGASSVLVDAGADANRLETHIDQRGIARPQGDLADVGAVELEQDDDPPNTQITKKPRKRTSNRQATFEFSADEPATFECKLDDGSFKDCESPFTKRVSRRQHTFKVRATDIGGNVEVEPARFSWTVKNS